MKVLSCQLSLQVWALNSYICICVCTTQAGSTGLTNGAHFPYSVEHGHYYLPSSSRCGRWLSTSLGTCRRLIMRCYVSCDLVCSVIDSCKVDVPRRWGLSHGTLPLVRKGWRPRPARRLGPGALPHSFCFVTKRIHLYLTELSLKIDYYSIGFMASAAATYYVFLLSSNKLVLAVGPSTTPFGTVRYDSGRTRWGDERVE